MRNITNTPRTLRTLASDTGGAAAVEFGMIVPFIFFSLVAMVDLGQVANQRLDMDSVVRAGAESAMINSDEDSILKVLESTAETNFSLASEADADNTYTAGSTYPISLSVDRLCECPDAPGVEVDCGNICPAELPPNVFVDLSAAKEFSGMILPTFQLSSASRVQLR